jgi:hypothetical protein
VKITKSLVKRKYRDGVLSGGYYDVDSKAFEITARIFDEFNRTAAGNKSLPLIVLFPGKDDVIRYLAEGTRVYSPLLEYFDRRRYPYIDLLGDFAKAGKDLGVSDLFTGHYSPLGNEIVAARIRTHLLEEGLDDPAGILNKLRETGALRSNTPR